MKNLTAVLVAIVFVLGSLVFAAGFSDSGLFTEEIAAAVGMGGTDEGEGASDGDTCNPTSLASACTVECDRVTGECIIVHHGDTHVPTTNPNI